MRKISTIFIPLLAGLAIMLTACNKDDDSNAEKQVSLDKTSLSLSPGASELLKASITPASAANAELQWRSSNPSIVTVDNGTVTAVAGGTATITVTITENGNKADCAVMVNKAINDNATIVNWK